MRPSGTMWMKGNLEVKEDDASVNAHRSVLDASFERHYGGRQFICGWIV